MLADRIDPCRLLGLVCATLIALPGGVVAADVYRWQDDDGVVHFGSNPPTGVDAERVDLDVSRPQPADSTPSDPQSTASADNASESRSDTETAETPEPEPLPEQRCERLARDYTMLESRPAGILVPDDDGNVRRLSADERDERMARIREQIDTRCP